MLLKNLFMNGGFKKFWNRWGYLVLGIMSLLIFIYLYFRKRDVREDEITVVFTNAKKKRSSCSKGEKECKRVMENIFGVPFIKIRPKWLMNPDSGKNLELDVYNPDLKIAVEYQGAQHSYYNKYFHKNEDDFKKQQGRDEYKRKKCKEYGILLIEVPYSIDNENIGEYLIKELKKNGKM